MLWTDEALTNKNNIAETLETFKLFNLSEYTIMMLIDAFFLNCLGVSSPALYIFVLG